jgi:hypothetical protein
MWWQGSEAHAVDMFPHHDSTRFLVEERHRHMRRSVARMRAVRRTRRLHAERLPTR